MCDIEPIDISKFSKSVVLKHLYDGSQSDKLTMVEAVEGVMDQAGCIARAEYKCYDLHGVLVDLTDDDFDPKEFDRVNGPGAAARIISKIPSRLHIIGREMEIVYGEDGPDAGNPDESVGMANRLAEWDKDRKRYMKTLEVEYNVLAANCDNV